MRRKTVERKFFITGFFSSYAFSWDSEFVFNGESHEAWEIVFVQAGRVEVTENEKVYRLERGNMIIHAPWEFHRIKSADGTSPRLLVMSFFAEGDLPENISEGIFNVGEDAGEEYRGIFDRISAFLNSDDSSCYAGQDAADRLSSFLIEICGENATARLDTSPSAAEYRRLVLAMSSGVCENKALADFAHECGDSVSYIKKLFAKYAGISPKAYYNNLRVARAMELLKEGKTISEVAEEMNFSSSSYFSAFFKKHTGSAPVQHKKRR